MEEKNKENLKNKSKLKEKNVIEMGFELSFIVRKY